MAEAGQVDEYVEKSLDFLLRIKVNKIESIRTSRFKHVFHLKTGKRILAYGSNFIKFRKVIVPAVVKGTLTIVGIEV